MRRVKFKMVYVDSRGRRHSAFASGKYNRNYSKGATVRAREGTLGVAVFKTKKQAEAFQGKIGTHYKIISVLPIGRKKTVEYICNAQSERSLDFFYNEKLGANLVPPPGTIFYPAVEVLE